MDYIESIHQISEIMIHDVVSPAVAGRYYAYISIVGYEVIAKSETDRFLDLETKLNAFPHINQTMEGNKIDPSFGAVYAVLKMGEELLPSGYMLDSAVQTVVDKAQKYLDDKTLSNTISFSETLTKAIARYASDDHYREINGLAKYTPLKKPGSWIPTPPAYMQALDPYWSRIRPFTLDSASQFRPNACIPYSEDSSSSFFLAAMDVYRTGLHLTTEQKAIADFWDCNPFAVQQSGHVDFGVKKISPGGHWMNIAGIACLKRNLPLEQTIRVHTALAIALADGFISCWDEKYRSNRIRPETFINKKIDPDWRPYLQTPPFPEYPSGHSVVSNAAATVLTKLMGENFSFTDNTEEEFDLPARSFHSFYEAAAEASVSRFYGGIHFRDAVGNGAAQGKQVGDYVIRKLGF